MQSLEKARQDLSTDLGDLTKHYLNVLSKNIFNQFYAGKIVDNNDPQKLGRCKVRVFGQFDGIPDVDLPWAVPDFNFIGSNLGSFIVPENGCIVNVYFRDGDLYFPHYTTKIVQKNSMPKEKDEDYPNTMVFYETEQGDYFKINRKTFEFVFRHSSGTLITGNKNGDFEIDNTNSTSGKIDIKSNGTIFVQTSGLCEVDALSIKFPNGTVAPVAGGLAPFVALPLDTLTGLPQGGNILFKTP